MDGALCRFEEVYKRLYSRSPTDFHSKYCSMIFPFVISLWSVCGTLLDTSLNTVPNRASIWQTLQKFGSRLRFVVNSKHGRLSIFRKKIVNKSKFSQRKLSLVKLFLVSKSIALFRFLKWDSLKENLLRERSLNFGMLHRGSNDEKGCQTKVGRLDSLGYSWITNPRVKVLDSIWLKKPDFKRILAS